MGDFFLGHPVYFNQINTRTSKSSAFYGHWLLSLHHPIISNTGLRLKTINDPIGAETLSSLVIFQLKRRLWSTHYQIRHYLVSRK